MGFNLEFKGLNIYHQSVNPPYTGIEATGVKLGNSEFKL